MTPEPRIEPLAREGVSAALPLLQAQFAEHAIPLPPDALAEALRGLVERRDRGAALMACAPEPIGIAVLSWTWTLEHGGRVGWLEELYVAPPFRNRGIGRRLLAAALETARAEGCRAVDLEVAVEHRRAERLYERAGFRRLDRTRFSIELGPAERTDTRWLSVTNSAQARAEPAAARARWAERAFGSFSRSMTPTAPSSAPWRQAPR